MATARSINRRWFRFGLRTLLIALTVLCVWLGFKVNAARRQHEVVQAILQAGGTVAYDYQLKPVKGFIDDDFNINSDIASPVPGWLRSIFGNDFFSDVNYVDLNGGLSPEFEINRLTDLPSLLRLNIHSRSLREADLAVIGRLPRLRELRLFEVALEGPALKSLVGLKHLKQLHLGTQIDDSYLEQVGKLTTLENVTLIPDYVSDAGLQFLSNIPKLNLILLTATAPISDSRVEALCRLENLDVLWFFDAHFTDETSLKRLGNLKNLGGLNFVKCNITDVGLQSLCEGLRGNTKLVRIQFTRSHATAQGIRELQQALPNTIVVGP
jgi:hypothetical protein